MIVGSGFEDDQNEILKEAQHGLYFGEGHSHIAEDELRLTSIGYLFHTARKCYLFHSEPNPLFFPERETLYEIGGFDHRVVQSAHDLMAEYFRWLFRHAETPAFASTPETLRSFWQDSWILYLRREASDLFWNNVHIAEALLMAIARENTPDGYKAEDKLMDALITRYQGPFTDARNAYRENS